MASRSSRPRTSSEASARRTARNDEDETGNSRKRRRTSSSRNLYVARPSIYDVVAGRVTANGYLPRFRQMHSQDLFGNSAYERHHEDEDFETNTGHKRLRRRSHSVSRNRFAPTVPYRDTASYTHEPLLPYTWLLGDSNAPTDDPERPLWGAAERLGDPGGFEEWARSRGVLPQGSMYSHPAIASTTMQRARSREDTGSRGETDLNASTASLSIGEGKSEVDVRSDNDTEEGEDSSFEKTSSEAESLPEGYSLEIPTRLSRQTAELLPETWTLPPHEEVGTGELDFREDEATRLPSSDLLKALHAYTADIFTALYRPIDPPCHGSMDETALLALGILMEEMLQAELEGHEMEFAEQKGDLEPYVEVKSPSLQSNLDADPGVRSRSRSRSTSRSRSRSSSRSRSIPIARPKSKADTSNETHDITMREGEDNGSQVNKSKGASETRKPHPSSGSSSDPSASDNS